MAASRTTGRTIRGLDAEARKLQRREALLQAALKLFANEGYLSTSIEQLCQHAYVGTKAFYETFESRDDLYVALLTQIADTAFTRLDEADDPSVDEDTAARRLLAEFAHAFVDDIRIAKVTFGQGSAITPAAERQRRANRRTAAAFVETVWNRYQPEPADQSHAIAIGLIGGLFDIIADWVLDHPSTPAAAELEELNIRLVAFYMAVRARHLHGNSLR